MRHRRVRPSTRRLGHRRALRFVVCTILTFVILWVVLPLYWWNDSFVKQESEAPLDHLTANLWKPLYSFTCPTMGGDGSSNSSSTTISTKWHELPPIIMISARPKDQVDPVLKTWTDGGFQVQLISTAAMSRAYRKQRCQKASFKSRLFGIYLSVMQQQLHQQQPLDYLVTLEDDVVLVDGDGFREELQYAMQHQLDFYSFHKASSSSPKSRASSGTNCIYQWGTQAQVWSRKMIERTLQVDDDAFCRLPIDMYIAQKGPWYVTQRELVRHVGKRFQLPMSNK